MYLSNVNSLRIRFALRAAILHLGASAAVAAIASCLVFYLWYPYPYRSVAGGAELFLLVIGVDLVCGPLLTSVLFTPAKSRRELSLDLTLVVVIQVAALSYGLHAVALARPVIIAFEVDRFRVVSATELEGQNLKLAPGDLQNLSWVGPKLVGTRTPASADERLKSLDLSLQGLEPAGRPGWWQAYSLSTPEVRKRARSLASLRAVRPGLAEQIDRAAAEAGLPIVALYFLPLVSRRQADWIVLLDEKAAVVGYAPIDGF